MCSSPPPPPHAEQLHVTDQRPRLRHKGPLTVRWRGRFYRVLLSLRLLQGIRDILVYIVEQMTVYRNSDLDYAYVTRFWASTRVSWWHFGQLAVNVPFGYGFPVIHLDTRVRFVVRAVILKLRVSDLAARFPDWRRISIWFLIVHFGVVFTVQAMAVYFGGTSYTVLVIH